MLENKLNKKCCSPLNVGTVYACILTSARNVKTQKCYR